MLVIKNIIVNNILPIVVISSISDLAEGTIGLQKRVFSLDYIAVTGLVLGLVVTSVRVGY